MDLTTLNIDNYSDHELFELFDIEVENIHNQDLLKDKYNQLIKEIYIIFVKISYYLFCCFIIELRVMGFISKSSF